MGLVNLASRASLQHGYDYFKSDKVLKLTPLKDGVYSALVSGSEKQIYHVTIDIYHPRKSSCDCPHAKGRRVICKHMIAAYFTADTSAAEEFYKNVVEAEELSERQYEEFCSRLTQHVYDMDPEDVRQALLSLLLNGPEWQLDQFAWEYALELDDDEDYEESDDDYEFDLSDFDFEFEDE